MERKSSIGKNSTLTRNLGGFQPSSHENSFKNGTRHGAAGEDTNSGDAQSFEFESPGIGLQSPIVKNIFDHGPNGRMPSPK